MLKPALDTMNLDSVDLLFLENIGNLVCPAEFDTGATCSIMPVSYTHPDVYKRQVLEYRQYAKWKSTYAEGLLKALEPDGRIHTSFQMTVTATGRLSSTEPNLQNIPTRTDLGSEDVYKRQT